MRIAIAALTLAVVAPTAGAATLYPINFAPLAADSGQVVTTIFDEGTWRLYVDNMRVIGASSPGYSGVVGLQSINPNSSVSIIDLPGTPTALVFTLDSLSMSFASTPDGSNVAYDAFVAGPNGITNVQARGRAPLTYTSSNPIILNEGPQTDIVSIVETGANQSQITGLVIGATLPSPSTSSSGGATPEPSGLVLAGIGLAAVMATARRRSSCPRAA